MSDDCILETSWQDFILKAMELENLIPGVFWDRQRRAPKFSPEGGNMALRSSPLSVFVFLIVTKLSGAALRKKDQQKIALAIASSGIAATLLNGERTAYSAFQLPLDIKN
ncbi:hypothetical protein TNCV_2994101 [Trichonephila clavipes]|nr:hypothetical protein TNCV_2994101 [Trichonephila clavipes]